MNLASSVPDPMVVSVVERLGESVRSGANFAPALKSKWVILRGKCFWSSRSSLESVGEGGTLVEEALVSISFAGRFSSDEAFKGRC